MIDCTKTNNDTFWTDTILEHRKHTNGHVSTLIIKTYSICYYNMYTMHFTVHILRQFFGPFSNLIFEMIGLSYADDANGYECDLNLEMISYHIHQNMWSLIRQNIC